MLRLQHVPFGSMQDGQSKCFALDEQTHLRKVAYGIRGESDDLNTSIRSDGHQTRCSKILQRQANGLTAHAEASSKCVLVQNGAGKQSPETNIFSKLIGHQGGGVWIHGSKLGCRATRVNRNVTTN